MANGGKGNDAMKLKHPAGNFDFAPSSQPTYPSTSLPARLNLAGQLSALSNAGIISGPSNNAATQSQGLDSDGTILPYRPAPLCGKRKTSDEYEERNVRVKRHGRLKESQFAFGDDPMEDVDAADQTRAEPQEQEIKDSDLDNGKMDSVPILKLLYGRRLPLDPNLHAKAFVKKIVAEVKKRNKAQLVSTLRQIVHGHLRESPIQGLVTKGRTTEFIRREYDLKSDGFKNSLLSYFNLEFKDRERLYDRIEAYLYYLVCWNYDAFPELTQRKGTKQAFPPLSPGVHDSAFNALIIVGVDPKSLNFNKPGHCASTIYRALLKRVQTTMPNSHLLRTPEFNLANSGTTLAFVPENFQSALVKVIQNALNDTEAKKMRPKRVEEVVEAFMYKLAAREPQAFPELFYRAEAWRALTNMSDIRHRITRS